MSGAVRILPMVYLLSFFKAAPDSLSLKGNIMERLTIKQKHSFQFGSQHQPLLLTNLYPVLVFYWKSVAPLKMK